LEKANADEELRQKLNDEEFAEMVYEEMFGEMDRKLLALQQVVQEEKQRAEQEKQRAEQEKVDSIRKAIENGISVHQIMAIFQVDKTFLKKHKLI